MVPMTFALLENGLDSAHYALEKLAGTPGKRELKHAVLFLSSAVELVFKERLRRKDWKLLFAYGVPLAKVDTPRVDKPGAGRVEGCS